MRFILAFMGFCFFASCQSDKDQSATGSLSHLQRFQVVAFFSPYENFDKTHLLNVLVNALQEVGRVEIVKGDEGLYSSKDPILFFLSLGGYQQKAEGSIQIATTVEVMENRFRTFCPIWRIDSSRIDESLPYPVLENGKVSFKRTEQQILSSDPELVLKQMIAEFAKEYRKSNLDSESPIFYIQQKNAPL